MKTIKPTYIVADIHSELNWLNYLLETKPNSHLIFLGDYGNKVEELDSLVIWLYIYNICAFSPNKKVSQEFTFLQGNHEWDKRYWTVTPAAEKLFQKAITIVKQQPFYDEEVVLPRSISELRQWLNNLPLIWEDKRINNKQEKIIVVHGWYDPQQTYEQLMKKDDLDATDNISHPDYRINGFTWGSPGKIELFKKIWSSYQSNHQQADFINQENEKNWYCGYASLDAYNDFLKEKKMVVVNGHWTDIFNIHEIEPYIMSNLWIIVGNDQNQISSYGNKYDKSKAFLGVLDITDVNHLKLEKINDEIVSKSH